MPEEQTDKPELGIKQFLYVLSQRTHSTSMEGSCVMRVGELLRVLQHVKAQDDRIWDLMRKLDHSEQMRFVPPPTPAKDS